MKPIPTIHPHFIPLSLATAPSEPRKLSTVRIFQPDELQAFKSTLEIRSFADVTIHIKLSKEYSDFQLEISNDCITAYSVVGCNGKRALNCKYSLLAILLVFWVYFRKNSTKILQKVTK